MQRQSELQGKLPSSLGVGEHVLKVWSRDPNRDLKQVINPRKGYTGGSV